MVACPTVHGTSSYSSFKTQAKWLILWEATLTFSEKNSLDCRMYLCLSSLETALHEARDHAQTPSRHRECEMNEGPRFIVRWFQTEGSPGGAGGKETTCQCRRLKRQRVHSLGREDPLEEEMATHFSILVWKIPRTEEPGGLQSTGSQRFRHAHVSDWSHESDAQSSGTDYKVAPHTSYSASRGSSKYASDVMCARRGRLKCSETAKAPSEVTTVTATWVSSY